MKIEQQKINQFFGDLASKKPAPGGGSASALSGTMAAALVEKVATLTLGKEKYREVQEEIKQLSDQAIKLRKELLKLADEDAEAYLAVVKTKGSQKAVLGAAKVPLQTAEKALEVLKMAGWLAEHGNQNARSDAFCAMELAQAAVYGALENVRINLPYLKNQKKVEELKEAVEKALNGAQELVKP